MALVLILVLYASVGFMAVAGSIYLSQRFLPASKEPLAFGLFLVAIACFYLVFLIHFGDEKAWPMEVSAIIAFSALGLLGIRLPMLLILGYALHGAWDLLHELHAHTASDPFGGRVPSQIPLAYGVFCAAYDWGIAAYLYLRRSHWNADSRMVQSHI